MVIREKVDGLSPAIKGLRQKLGATHARMARLLGVSLRTYDRWEAGHTIPRGLALVKILDLCPDEETRTLFLVAAASTAPRRAVKRPASSLLGRRSPEDRLRMRLRNTCVEAIQIIYDSALLGSAAADEKLRHYADELNRDALVLANALMMEKKSPVR